jgi:pSer/pThr/pTyr-binding forkhead associated (FHA) protein/S1-C subfamily serine protease
MVGLVAELDGRVLRLDGKTSYRIGRAIEADVVLTAGSVSRQHAEIRLVGGLWVLVDAGSNFGTYVDGERITEYGIEQRITVRCGPPAPGAELVIIPADQYDEVLAAPPAPPAPPVAPPPPPAPASAPQPVPDRPVAPPAAAPVMAGNEATQILAAAPPSVPGQVGPPPVRSGPDLLLVAEGREHRFRHPAQITVGRRSDCTVVIGDPACSRVHGRIDAHPGGWTWTNLSSEGTWLDGRRVDRRPFDERVSLRLGHPVAGTELTLVPILSAAEEERRIARRRWGRRLVVVGAVAAGLLLVGGLLGAAWLVLRDDSSTTAGERSSSGGPSSMDTLTNDELDSAKAAAVKITADTVDLADQPVSYGGSGSIIRADGLILTNAHVAAPESPGLAEQYVGLDLRDPDFLLIHLTDGRTDTNSPAAYRARVVEADGYLDVAVIQVYARADGSPLGGDLSLPTVPMGDSDALRAGDDVTVLGFPAIARSEDSITVTTGVVSTVINDGTLGPRSELDTDARIAPGNSGGMAINNDGELIGIPTALLPDQGGSSVLSGRIRSIDPVKELITAAEAAVG